MTRRLLAPLAGALLVAAGGCPLSQPLPEVARTPDGGAVSTPIVLPDTAIPQGAVSYLAKDCPGGAGITFSASIEDLDTNEAVEARWFRNYVSTQGSTGLLSDVLNVPASADSSNPLRVVPPLTFVAYLPTHAASGPVDVVDLVVSNNFLALEDPTPP
ncbi:MAG TPA: hypothetical protein VF400_14150, partial [Anaeromyxobacteraceae bacterium]